MGAANLLAAAATFMWHKVATLGIAGIQCLASPFLSKLGIQFLESSRQP